MLASRTIRTVVASAAVVTGVAFGGAAPAYAAYPSNSFNIPYGNAYTKGTLAWQNRSIAVDGTIKTTDGNCREVVVSAYVDTADGPDQVGNYVSGAVCSYPGDGSVTGPFTGTINTNVRGAADYVEVCLYGSPFEQDPSLLKCGQVRHP